MNASGRSLTEKKDKKSKRKQQEEEECGANGSAEGDDLNGGSGGNDEDGDDEGTWSVDVDAAAVKQRMKELTSGVKGLAMDDDLEKSEVDRINILHDFVQEKLKGEQKLEVADEKAILAEAERLEIQNKTPIVLCELLFTGGKILAEIKANKRLMLRFTHGNQKAQKYLLGGIEKTIETHKDALLPKVAHIFKTLYDEDIVEEEVILEWGKKVSKKYVSKDLSELIHKKADPFLKWLKEAEEETSEEEESDVELEFDEKAKISTIKEKVDEPVANGSNGKKNASPVKADEREEEEDDLDIDDI